MSGAATRVGAMTYTLVLLRHGESEWNAKNLFTGWVDVDLNDKGRGEAVAGGRQLVDAGLLAAPDGDHVVVPREVGLAVRGGRLHPEPREQATTPPTYDPDDVDRAATAAATELVALVDELAHSNAPGSRNAKRWQDVDELLDAGIDVISTVNIQHLESLNDVTAQITGVRQRETVPDPVVRSADQIELVDMSPQSLRRRMAHGNIYAPVMMVAEKAADLITA